MVICYCNSLASPPCAEGPLRCEEPWDQGNCEYDKVFPEWSTLSALLALTQRTGGVIRWPQSVSQPLDQAGWQSLGTRAADSIYGIAAVHGMGM